MTNEYGLEEVFVVRNGLSQATIPSGLTAEGGVSNNELGSWHIDSEDIRIAELTIELREGTTSQAEENLD